MARSWLWCQVRVELRDDTGTFSIAAASADDDKYDEERDDDDDGIVAVFHYEYVWSKYFCSFFQT